MSTSVEVPRFNDDRLAEVFTREVLGFLVGRELLSPEWAERILSWRHTGFSVHSTDFSVVDRIINHLKLTFVSDKPPSPRIAYQEILVATETSAEYFS